MPRRSQAIMAERSDVWVICSTRN